MIISDLEYCFDKPWILEHFILEVVGGSESHLKKVFTVICIRTRVNTSQC